MKFIVPDRIFRLIVHQFKRLFSISTSIINIHYFRHPVCILYIPGFSGKSNLHLIFKEFSIFGQRNE